MDMVRKFVLFPGMLLLLLAGCAKPPPTPTDPGEVLAYDCDCVDIVTALQGDTLQLYLFRDVFTLSRVPTASGTKYSDGTNSFWSKGETAILESADEIYPNCRIDRRRTIWEAARLRGASFRAVGQEPGWHLEIGAEEIKAVLDYGSRTLTFATPEPVTTSEGTRYHRSSKGQSLDLLLLDKDCQDTMSGEEFDRTVELRVDENVYLGCGRNLQK